MIFEMFHVANDCLNEMYYMYMYNVSLHVFVSYRNHRKPSLLSSAMSSPSSEDNEKTEKDIDTLLMQFDTHGELEFKMDERTYRMIPLANSGDYLYKRDSLATASRVSFLISTTIKINS